MLRIPPTAIEIAAATLITGMFAMVHCD